MRKKKQPMSTASQVPPSSLDAEELSLPADHKQLEAILGSASEELVRADQLPSAAGTLAELFPPEEFFPEDSQVRTAAQPSDTSTLGSTATFFTQAPTEQLQTSEQLSSVGADLVTSQSEFHLEPAASSSEVVGESPSAGEAVSEDLSDAAEQAPWAETDSSQQGPGAVKSARPRKKSRFSGLAAARKGLLRDIFAIFKGTAPSAPAVSPTESTCEVVEATAQTEEFASVHGQSGSAANPVEQAASTEAVTDIQEQPSAAEPLHLHAEIAGNAQNRSIGNAPPEVESSPRASKSRISASENASFEGQEERQNDGAAFLPATNEIPVGENGAPSDYSEVESISEEADIVDPRDDDQAIASAIERYANLTDPARAKLPEPEQPHAIELAHGPQPDGSDLNTILGIPRDAEPEGEPANSIAQTYLASSVQIPDIGELPIPSATFSASAFEEAAATAPPREISAQEPPENAVPSAAPAISARDWSFEEKLASHHEWIESKGATGKRIDFAAADLEGNDLIGANLRYMDLHDANLKAADLLMADLRDACLVRANFRDACLVGANLEAANLEGASLETSMGLVPHQLAGANLHDAALPAHILKFEALSEFRRASRVVYGYFVAMTSLSVLSWLIIWMTKDFQLITNSAILPFLHSQTAAAALPTVQFYLIAPFALFIVYLVFHFQLQHLWDAVLELPAVFPDGRLLGENEPRLVVGLLRTHFRWMNQDAPSTRVIEKAISTLVAYWIVPATLLLYWLRYLTLEEIHGTILQEFLIIAAAGAALYSTTKIGRPAARWTLSENIVERAFGKLSDVNPVKTALVFLAALTFIAAGTMLGVPHSKDRAPQFGAGSIRRWAPAVLWSFGIDPYADLTEAVISTKPANWNGSDEQVSSVKGARLNDANFRYAQAYRVFLANAHLLHAKFQGAFLSQADLRGADLGQSDLRYAILDQAQMNHADLDRAVLDGANLSRSDLRAANLSYASLGGATLVDARLEGATLYGAKLTSATMIRTNLEKADLRESYLSDANLEHADMQGAYLWSAKLPSAHLNNAQLGTAIFVDADLRGADLRWAQLPGTVLTGSDLTGALLDGADFRAAVGFGANQICSAKSRKGLLLDDAMQAQVTAQCGAGN